MGEAPPDTTGDRMTSARRAAAMVGVLVLVALAIFLFPAPADIAGAQLAAKSMRSPRGAIALVGNSVIDHVSKCDSDRRTIAQMIAAEAARPTIDLSKGGQDYLISFGLGAIGMRHGGADTLVLPVTVATLAMRSGLDGRDQGFFRIAGGDYPAFDVVRRIARLEPLIPPPPAQQERFTYRGQDYPDYVGVKSGHFARAQAEMGCPEDFGVDPGYSEALYWNSYARFEPQDERIAGIIQLHEESARRGKRLLVVLMPVDLEDVAGRNPALAQLIAQRSAALADRLRGAGVDPLDLTRSAPAGQFTDRWCACGHLNQHGRLALARAVAGALR